MTKLGSALAALALAATAGVALAQPPAGAPRTPPPPPARGPAMDVAVEMAEDAIAACNTNGYKVGAVVVDSEGATKVLLVGDGARSRGAETAVRKAFTAITFKKSSGEAAAEAKADKAVADRIAADPKMIAAAGAKLLMVGGTTIGALAVGGAPGGNLDEACADAAIAKVGPRLR
jgi:uncharacterized protein GlcG (DUF336 family)